MDVKELAGQYARQSDEELLLLAVKPDDLVPEAQTALSCELAKRGITPAPPKPLPQSAIAAVAARPISVTIPAPRKYVSPPWQVLWFFVQLVLIYVTVTFFSPRVAYWSRDIVVAIVRLQDPPSRFEFLFNHIFLFSFLPLFVTGLLMARLNNKAALFVWTLPAAVLVLSLLSYSAKRSVFVPQTHILPAFHYYFGGGFVVPDFRTWEEFWSVVAPNADYVRGIIQLRTTGPFYAAVGYSLAVFVATRSRLHEAIDAALGI